LYASNDGYAPLLGVSLYSLLKNNKEEQEIRLFIFNNAISQENISRLKKTAGDFGREITFIDISDLEQRIGFPINSCGYNITTFARLFIEDLLPEETDKLLYLDSDIIVRDSLKELWETDIEDYLLGAVVEVYMPENRKKVIGLEKEEPYYNAGMLLINRAKWQKQGMKEAFFNYYRRMQGELLYNDQDIINHCCRGQIKAVHPTYNFEPNVYYFPYNYMRKINPLYFTGNRLGYQTMIASPKMIHFLGDERPWVKGNQNPYSRVFLEYMEESGWKDVPWVEGKETYMLTYHLLNVMTRICPPLRTLATNLIGINKFKWFGKQ
jgi:lipopolysaccharide biosynthesis glycosyltransferase